VIWLQNYISGLTNTTVVCISHDRDFLDAITEELIILKQKKLKYFDGNPSEYEKFSLQKRKGQVKMRDALDKKKEAVEKSIETGLRNAKKTGDDNRMRMVKSRQKKLDERWGMERNEKGHRYVAGDSLLALLKPIFRFKINRDFGGYHTTLRGEVEVEDLERPVTLPFDDPEPMRFPGALISASNLSFRYSAKSPVVLENVDLTIHPGARVALLGRNGEGKSTLVKLLIGVLPSKSVERHPRLRLGYFDQLSVEVLSEERNKTKSLIDYFKETMQERYNIAVEDQVAREMLGRFGLGAKAMNSIQILSGGQKVRTTKLT
jgi:ATP-binding cassette, subfamily F, member 3